MFFSCYMALDPAGCSQTLVLPASTADRLLVALQVSMGGGSIPTSGGRQPEGTAVPGVFPGDHLCSAALLY